MLGCYNFKFDNAMRLIKNITNTYKDYNKLRSMTLVSMINSNYIIIFYFCFCLIFLVFLSLKKNIIMPN